MSECLPRIPYTAPVVLSELTRRRSCRDRPSSSGAKGMLAACTGARTISTPLIRSISLKVKSVASTSYYSLLYTSFISTDVAVPGLNRNFAHSRKILISKATIQRTFEEAVAPIHKQIHGLHKYNHSLAEARDLLLPRLMNGEVPV